MPATDGAGRVGRVFSHTKLTPGVVNSKAHKASRLNNHLECVEQQS
jgi:hypothetical protein